MSLKVIKYVAGAGKTTDSIKYLNEHKQGIYLAFNNKVVDDITNRGYLGKTIDSLFISFILPKLISLIPLISGCKTIKYIENDELKYKGVANLKIDSNGNICNHGKNTGVSLDDDISKLFSDKHFPNKVFLEYVFRKNIMYLTNELRNSLFEYILTKFPDLVIQIMTNTFSFAIIDEAQDLKKSHEKFAKILSESSLELILYGDDNQNINGGGNWFKSLSPISIVDTSKRCPEENCKWVRNNLDIIIFGQKNLVGGIIEIKQCDSLKYNDSKKTLLYPKIGKSTSDIINSWTGEKYTIKKAKGMTIENDIVIIGKQLSKKNAYTAITRTKQKAYISFKVKL